MVEWGDVLARAKRRPALAIIATEDPYNGGEVPAAPVGRALRGEVVVLDGLGHWWMLEDPVQGAAVLSKFLASRGLTSTRHHYPTVAVERTRVPAQKHRAAGAVDAPSRCRQRR